MKEKKYIEAVTGLVILSKGICTALANVSPPIWPLVCIFESSVVEDLDFIVRERFPSAALVSWLSAIGS